MITATDPADQSTAADADARAMSRMRFGWYVNDWANAAFSATVLTVFIGPYLTTVAKNAADAHGDVHPLGLSIRAGSYFPYTVSFSVLVSVAVMLLAGTVADRTGRHKELMCGFAYVGALATMGMFFLDGDRYLLGGALLVVANIAYAVSVALSYAFLPGLATADERDTVSSKGWAVGYAGGGLLLIANLALFEGTTLSASPPARRFGSASPRRGSGGRCSPWCRCSGCRPVPGRPRSPPAGPPSRASPPPAACANSPAPCAVCASIR